MSKYPVEEDDESNSNEAQEYKILEKILNNQPLDIEEHAEETMNMTTDPNLKASLTLQKLSKDEEERDAKK